MSKNNRKAMYETLKANGQNGITPDLSQDDGSLEKEFGKPVVPKTEEPVVPKDKPKGKGKK